MGGAMLGDGSAQRPVGVVPQVGRCWNVVALLVVIPFQNIPRKKAQLTEYGQ